MKIAHVNFKFLDEGGRSEYIFQLARGFCEKGNEVFIVTSKAVTGRPINKRRVKKVANLKVIALPAVPISIPSRRYFIPKLVEELYKLNVDIVHTHGIGDMSTEMALLASKARNIPTVITPHFHPFWAYKEKEDRDTWKAVQEVFGQIVLKNSDWIVCNSPQEKADITEMFKDHIEQKISVVAEGIDSHSFSRASSEARIYARYKIPRDKDIILMIADLKNPRKGLYEAIKIVDRIRKVNSQVHLVACGSWPRSNFSYKIDHVLPLIHHLGVEDFITIIPSVSIRDRNGLYKMAKVYLSPTVYESFGLAVGEALYMGLPVVATAAGGVNFVAKNNVDSFLVPDQEDVKNFADNVIYLLKNRDIAQKMGSLGSKRVKNTFTWDKAVNEVEKIYKKVLT